MTGLDNRPCPSPDGPDRTELRGGLAVALRLAGLLAALFAAVLVVGGCGAGPSAQTSQEAPAVNGAESGGGPIVVRDAMIVMPSGSGGSSGTRPERPLPSGCGS